MSNLATDALPCPVWPYAPIMDPWSGPLVGAYLLVIDVGEPCAVTFGRYRGGQSVVVKSGQVLYIGSAKGSGDQPRLGQRVLRHLTRSDDKPPHALRTALADHVQRTTAVALLRHKTLHWHIDYLLDRPEVNVVAVWLARGAQVDEAAIASTLQRTEMVAPVADGLGASDHPRATHLLYWTGPIEILHQTISYLCQQTR